MTAVQNSSFAVILNQMFYINLIISDLDACMLIYILFHRKFKPCLLIWRMIIN